MDGSKVFSTNDTGPVADAVKQHWVDTRLPAGLRPYARLARWERPIGWWLLLWPCFWSAALAAVAGGKAWPDPWHMVLFFIGAVAMRGAGCTYNDLVDVDIDSKVERTRSRPIPAGQVSRLQAKIFLVVQALIGLAVLLQFNTYTIWLGIASLLPVAVYPFMKRITNWPQLFLGFAFSWGALMGWAAAFGSLSWSPVFLYIGGICWTIGYDTIYAHQDKEDDALVGVKSTARLFDEHTKPALILLYSCATALFFLAAIFADAGPAAFIGILAGVIHLGWQIVVLDIDDGDQCLQLFRSNGTYGWILFFGFFADALIGAL
ncbi:MULTISPECIES: 4-hydroxybenzoate octaprenyltransferase [Stappiaceae]|jgi:4-hydroxybenzoate polyprenyltransferase|uniref:4-hydroxybenzoate octaprenyltransferase n=2 Tax=Roseibium TaxID=150830 RepID=A0A0M6Y486_9HYPH|nr:MULTISPECIES: 4-hydroxybenzoate octaprenyltransferase [Stappiaceae]MCR9281519.1 4-hydroxybenzoate octaprenyltransferase [Paracoccaceae bacterium]MEE2867263.1 4-hydroxybenzoate octaprenyltransferase [Pseudomonadota bacterium]AMN54801.1 4-hydroxybenzoate polyprenyltransferase [Labrenzia sp. CP4]AQQ03283.1 4-hydroxybenzoate polyprenyltransferase [Roseibium aggregatum]MBO6856168.1 4-hydroxybenzoate octaprenyltransferase [Roseibium sp.]